MALRVWLPLNGNLENKGLSPLTTTTVNGFTYEDGKIGQCAKGRCAWHLEEDFLDNKWTIAMWFKNTSAFGANNNILFCKNISNSTDCQIYFSIVGSSSLNIGVNGPSSSLTQSYSFETNKWYHLTATYDGNVVSLYINGIFQKSGTVTTAKPEGRLNMNINGRSTNAGNTTTTGQMTNGCFNDVRIYDHCLSKQEVKEISQGLVLHYKLDSSFIEATTNLITTEDCLSATCYNGATGKYNYGTTTDMYKEVTVFDGHKGTKVYMGTNGNSAFPYVYVNNMYTSDGTNAPEYKTLSFDYYTTIGTSIRPYKLGTGSGTATYWISNSSGILTGVGTDAVSIPVVSNEWNHIEITFHGTTADNAQWGYIQNYPTHTSNTSNFWFFSNMQLETKNHATSYVGVGGSRNIGYIKDSSGYGNDGIQNNIIISRDTPRYNYSIIFNGSNSYIKVENNNWMSQGAEALTVNFWAKATTWPTNGGRLISCTETGGFNLEAGNSGYWRFPIYVFTNAEKTTKAYKYDSKEIQISALTSNAWNMITLVYDTTGTKTYINGQLHHTYTNTSYGISFNTSARLFLGCEANVASPSAPFFNGQESDVRIYATALSAEDIKLLYDTPTLINKQAGWHTFMNNEDNRNEISKNGLIHSSEISEASFAEYLKYDSNIYFEPDGSAWIHIYHHNNPSAGSFASNDTFTTSVYKDVDRWFNATQICNNIDKWEFLIKYAYTAGGTEYKERWIQTRNPETAVFGDVDAVDITRITGNGYNTGSWGGLYKKNSSAYWVMNNGNSGNWWGAVGSFSIYQGGIPGYGGTVTTTGFNDLYVRIDNVDFLDTDEAKITKNGIYVGNNFVER